MKPIPVQCGDLMIMDAMNPRVEEIDIPGIEARLKTIKRFGGHPKALTVWQHSKLVRRIARRTRFSMREGTRAAMLRWCHYHDYHEGIIGDVIGPVEALVRRETPALDQLKERMDRVICLKLSFPFPDEEIRKVVHYSDKAAETLEWIYAMGQPPADWNHPVPKGLFEDDAARRAIEWARAQ